LEKYKIQLFPKIIGIFKVINMFLYVNELASGWQPSRWELVTGKTQAGLEGWDYQPYCPIQGGQRG
jgi:hypothetical protein